MCACCGGNYLIQKELKLDIFFQLGTKYSSAMNANFLDSNGKAQPFVMGCYGIGVSRLVAAVIEQNHDEKGCIWTKETAPFTGGYYCFKLKKKKKHKQVKIFIMN